MRRREFIALLGSGAAAARPLAAGAQQGDHVRRNGVLMFLAPDEPEARPRMVAFVDGLQRLGWTEGRNIQIESRWGAGNVQR